jgi:hypothetical protein
MECDGLSGIQFPPPWSNKINDDTAPAKVAAGEDPEDDEEEVTQNEPATLKSQDVFPWF